MRDNFPAEKKEDTEVKDEFKYFPFGYFSRMYFVLCVGGCLCGKYPVSRCVPQKKHNSLP